MGIDINPHFFAQNYLKVICFHVKRGSSVTIII
jgi:hypothetical protein